MQFGFIFVLVISIIISIFAIQNGNTVNIDLFFASFQVSQALVILVSTAVGAVIAAILGTIRQIKDFSNTKELKIKLKNAESQITNIDLEIEKYRTEIKSLTEENSKLMDDIAKLNELNQKKYEDIDNINSNEEMSSNGSKLNVNENAYLEDREKDEKNQAES